MEEKAIFWTIDRIEGEFAVIEIAAGKTLNLPLSALPEGAAEGTVLRIAIDRCEEEGRKKKIRSLFDRLRVD